MSELVHILRSSRAKSSAIVDPVQARQAFSRVPFLGGLYRGAESLLGAAGRGASRLKSGLVDTYAQASKADQGALAGAGFAGKAAYGVGMAGGIVGAPLALRQAFKKQPQTEAYPTVEQTYYPGEFPSDAYYPDEYYPQAPY